MIYTAQVSCSFRYGIQLQIIFINITHIIEKLSRGSERRFVRVVMLGRGGRRDVTSPTVTFLHIRDHFLVSFVILAPMFETLNVFLYPIGRFARLTVIGVKKTPIHNGSRRT